MNQKSFYDLLQIILCISSKHETWYTSYLITDLLPPKYSPVSMGDGYKFSLWLGCRLRLFF